MRRRPGLIVLLVFLGVIVIGGAGFFIFVWFTGGDGEASAPIEAEAVQPASPDFVAFDLDLEQSEARFLIDEVLRGQPKTVVGVTNQIDGSFALSLSPAQLEIGEFVINVRTIRTDDAVRDRVIRTLILESARDEYEFARFVPGEVTGLPESIEVGQTIEFSLDGDLTVRDVTTRTTFEMAITIESADTLSGNASSTITWEELDITIPYVGGDSIVASVADELSLELDFVAERRAESTDQ